MAASASSQPPRHHCFRVRVEPGTPVDAVITAAAAIVTINEVACVQHFGGLDYEITVKSPNAVKKMLETGSLRIANQLIKLEPAVQQQVSVTCLFLAYSVSNDALVTALAPYGKVTAIDFASFRDNPTVRTGTRYIKMEMNQLNPLPNFLRIAGHRATFEYRGVRRVCRRCGEEGHYKVNCSTPFCERCAVYGHRTDTCAAKCRRCKGDHASVDCTMRKLYSAAVTAESFPPLPSQGHADRSSNPNKQQGSADAMSELGPLTGNEVRDVPTPNSEDQVRQSQADAASSSEHGSVPPRSQDEQLATVPSSSGEESTRLVIDEDAFQSNVSDGSSTDSTKTRPAGQHRNAKADAEAATQSQETGDSFSMTSSSADAIPRLSVRVQEEGKRIHTQTDSSEGPARKTKKKKKKGHQETVSDSSWSEDSDML